MAAFQLTQKGISERDTTDGCDIGICSSDDDLFAAMSDTDDNNVGQFQLRNMPLNINNKLKSNSELTQELLQMSTFEKKTVDLPNVSLLRNNSENKAYSNISLDSK